MEITVTIKNVYGEDKVYPACEKSAIFARMLGQKTLTPYDIKNIKDLGYEVMVLTPTIKL